MKLIKHNDCTLRFLLLTTLSLPTLRRTNIKVRIFNAHSGNSITVMVVCTVSTNIEAYDFFRTYKSSSKKIFNLRLSDILLLNCYNV